MKRATLTETKNQLSALIDRVRHGETIVITDRGRPVARLTSVLADESEDAADGRVERLERQGLLRRASKAASPSLLRRSRPRPRGDGILSALLAERRSGR